MNATKAVAKKKENTPFVKAKQPTVQSNILRLSQAEGTMPSATAQMSWSSLTDVQSRAFISLLYLATTGQAELPKPEKDSAAEQEMRKLGLVDYCIDTKLLRDTAKYNNSNHKYFFDAVKSLKGKSIELNILGKDKSAIFQCHQCKSVLSESDTVCPNCGKGVESSRSVSSIAISGTILDTIAFTPDGKCFFSFGRLITNFIYKAENGLGFFYKFLSGIALGLDLKSARAIYCLVSDYANVQVPFMPVESFARIVGGDKYLSNFAKLKRYIIEPSIAEINEKSDITVVFDAKTDTRRVGKKTTELRLRCDRKKKPQDKLAQPELDFDANADTIEVGGAIIVVDEFAEWLSRNAEKKEAYKVKVLALLKEGKFNNLFARAKEFLAERDQKLLEYAQKVKQQEAAEYYKALSAIAKQAKGEPLENLYLRNPDDNTVVLFEKIIAEGRFYETASKLVKLAPEQFASLLVSEAEIKAFNAQDLARLKASIESVLEAIAPIKEWRCAIDGELYSVKAEHAKYWENAQLYNYRKIEKAIKGGQVVEFIVGLDGDMYSAGFANEKLILKKRDEANDD